MTKGVLGKKCKLKVFLIHYTPTTLLHEKTKKKRFSYTVERQDFLKSNHDLEQNLQLKFM